MLLADLGAEVVKVERPGEGDQSRAWGPPFAGGEATYFMSVNRGKRSVAVDLRDPRGQEVVRRLALRSDVVIENFLPGGAERLGLGRDALVAERPALVYTSIRGYPLDAPEADQPGFDFAIQGAGGIMSITGEPDGEPDEGGRRHRRHHHRDAGRHRHARRAARGARDGARPARRDVAARRAARVARQPRLGGASIGGVEPARFGNAHPSICPYETFRARDGYVNLAVGTDGQFRRFCELAGLDDVGADPRYATNRDRVAHRAELVPRLQAAFATRDADDWLAGDGRRRHPVRARAHDPAGAAGRARTRSRSTSTRRPGASARSARRWPSTARTTRPRPRRRCSASTRARCWRSSATTPAEVASLLEGPCVQASLP